MPYFYMAGDIMQEGLCLCRALLAHKVKKRKTFVIRGGYCVLYNTNIHEIVEQKKHERQTK